MGSGFVSVLPQTAAIAAPAEAVQSQSANWAAVNYLSQRPGGPAKLVKTTVVGSYALVSWLKGEAGGDLILLRDEGSWQVVGQSKGALTLKSLLDADVSPRNNEHRRLLSQHLGASAKQAPVAPALREAMSDLYRMSKVMILLPTALPTKLTPDQIWVTGSAGEQGYSLQLAFTPNCNGASCFMGSFVAGQEIALSGQTVKLVQGLTGYYRDRTCQNCGDASLAWAWNGTNYSIRFKAPGQTEAQRRTAMVQMANSAIQAGPR